MMKLGLLALIIWFIPFNTCNSKPSTSILTRSGQGIFSADIGIQIPDFHGGGQIAYRFLQ